MFNKIGFRTWKSGKLWLYMGVLGSTIILGSLLWIVLEIKVRAMF
ncbi:TPA: KxYKxGKxW signal peptide domain-containing protein [Streptococcus agalactiae]